MTNDKALEADKWPEPPEAVWVWGKYRKYVETYCEPTEIKQDEFEVPVTKYIRADLAVSDPLSTLPGEGEVVEFRGDAEKIRWLSAERERLIKAAVNVATQRNELLLSLQAMQARAEAAERERDEARLDRITAERDAQNMANQLVAAEASVKEMQPILDWAAKQRRKPYSVTMLLDALKGGSNG